MKVFAFTIALAGVTTAASLNAQSVPRPGTVITGTSSRRTDCSYNRTSNTVGDIIFGRTNLNTNPNTNTNCRDVYSREDGAWYQVGNGRSPIYERRVRDNYGYLIIQRARRNPDGSFTILNSRIAKDSDKEWKKEQKRIEKAQRRNGNSRYNRSDRDDDDDNGRYNDANYRYDQFGNRIYVGNQASANSRVVSNREYNNGSERKGHGKGKGKKGRD